MSRIQEILAKADRDGTAGLLQPAADLLSARSGSAGMMAPMHDGAAALSPGAFGLPTSSAAPLAPAVEPRTARPMLHAALVSALAPHSAIAEQYRAIRAKLSQREENGALRMLAVTSPGGHDGKSITAANLALTMAQEVQRNVVLVDADLRAPSVHTLFAIDRGPGLGDVLSGDAALDDALVHLPELGLMLLPAGTTPDYPTELLGSTGMRQILDELNTRFDRVVLDLPSVLPLADVRTVAPFVDGVLMVVRAGVTQRPLLDQALATFEDNKVVGVVLNDTE